MILTEKLLTELQKRLKIGNRRGVHLNAMPAKSRYKFDVSRLALIDKTMPDKFMNSLLNDMPMKFRISWKDSSVDLNALFEEEQEQLTKITKSFEYLINQTDAIEQEKGINTFGFGFPLLVRRDKKDGQLTVAPILIWSLRIKRTKEFNTWEVLRNDDDPVYINEILINYLEGDSGVVIDQIPSEMLDDGLISKEELVELCVRIIRSVNILPPDDIKDIFKEKIDKIVPIGDKKHYEKLPLNASNGFIEFGGLFSIFEVQKQNVINDYNNLMGMAGLEINLNDMDNHTFQSISSVETDPSQQSILHSLESSRNILIQGPPGTGKSQTLTAVLVNALENNKKTIVVCEKRTALEVLHNTLINKGLKNHCVLVRDIVKDRKVVVESVRERIDNSDYRKYTYRYSKEELNNIILRARHLIDSINNKHKKLDAKIIGSKSWTAVVGNLLSELKGCGDDINLNLMHEAFSFDTQELDALLTLAQQGQKLYHDYNAVKDYTFLNPAKLIGDNPYLIEQQINKDFEDYNKQVNDVKILLESTKSDFFVLRNSELKSQRELIENNIASISHKEMALRELIVAMKGEYYGFRQNDLNQQLATLRDLIDQIDAIFTRNNNNPDLTDTNKIGGFGYKLSAIFSKEKKQTIVDHKELQSLFDTLQSYIDGSRDMVEVDMSGNLSIRKTAFDKLKRHIYMTKDLFSVTTENEFEALRLSTILDMAGRDTVLQSIHLCLELPRASQQFRALINSFKERIMQYLSEMNALFAKLSHDLATCKDYGLIISFGSEFQENKTKLADIANDLTKIDIDFQSKIEEEFPKLDLLKLSADELKLKHLQELQTKVSDLIQKITVDSWSVNKLSTNNLYKFVASTEELILRKNDYFNSDKDLFTFEFRWFQFYGALDNMQCAVVNELKDKNNWRKTLLTFYLNALLLKYATVDLPSGDEEHRDLDAVLSNIEQEQLKYINQLWFSKQVDKTRDFIQNNNNLSVENLYNKRSSPNFKRLSLRQIVQKDADLFTTFFPIILTSPDVACNLFRGMNGYFDIVMFDEASQLRLEDNLPALLKGKQIVIAGDEHQMPPSNYFSKVFDGSIEDEDDVEEENEIVVDKDNLYLSCESLIDFASELNFKRKYLDFHYRSKHPYLIDFSNYAFYNQRLRPLPNNFDYVPIKYIQVNGTFSDYINEAEAETVLSIIDNNINRLPNGKYPSVGVATFNITQRNLIISKIQERQKFDKYQEFNTKIHELMTDGLFIKNLENIQGDERDVIILSTTYGPTPEGKFAQRFGPINHSKGYKLLNVIITRAKYKIYVCSSIPEDTFMNYKDYLVAEGSNNKRAVMYAYLAYCRAVSSGDEMSRNTVLTSLAENTCKSVGFDTHSRNGEAESPFEEEVYSALSEQFGGEKLMLQLPFAGFRIDLVYDSKISGVPKIAIECDGAKFHSSPEAYLHDQHRQKILERYGFVFHRIWSTNWWRNSNREVNKLVEFIKQVESSKTGNIKDYSKYAEAFTDELFLLEIEPVESFEQTDKN